MHVGARLVIALAIFTGCTPVSPAGAGVPAAPTAPPHPQAIAGYRPNAPIALTIFAQQDGTTIPDLIVTMNHCELTMRTIRWRSLGSDVTVTVFFDDTSGVISQQVATVGLLRLHQCGRPVFYAPPGTIVDVTIEYINWDVAP